MKNVLLSACILLLSGAACIAQTPPQTAAQTLEGTWNGTLGAGSVRLHLILTISKTSGGEYAGRLNSRDQGAILPMNNITLTGDAVRFEVKPVGGVYEGTLSKDRAEIESFLVLGFGGSGKDMLKSFDVSYLGNEKLGGVDTAKLGLVPKSVKIRNTFDHIWLWIDPARGVSVQQQLFEPSGDYRLAQYSDIQLHQKISDDKFRLKTTGKTKFVSPQG